MSSYMQSGHNLYANSTLFHKRDLSNPGFWYGVFWNQSPWKLGAVIFGVQVISIRKEDILMPFHPSRTVAYPQSELPCLQRTLLAAFEETAFPFIASLAASRAPC